MIIGAVVGAAVQISCGTIYDQINDKKEKVLWFIALEPLIERALLVHSLSV